MFSWTLVPIWRGIKFPYLTNSPIASPHVRCQTNSLLPQNLKAQPPECMCSSRVPNVCPSFTQCTLDQMPLSSAVPLHLNIVNDVTSSSQPTTPLRSSTAYIRRRAAPQHQPTTPESLTLSGYIQSNQRRALRQDPVILNQPEVTQYNLGESVTRISSLHLWYNTQRRIFAYYRSGNPKKWLASYW
jgi:hypothetical protein